MLLIWSTPAQLRYHESYARIPASVVGAEFGSNIGALTGRLANTEPAHRVPSAHERRYCDITKKDCPVRVEADYVPEGTTEDF